MEKKKKTKPKHTNPQILETLRVLSMPFSYWCILQLSPVCVLYFGNSGNVNQLVSPGWFCRVTEWLGELKAISVPPLPCLAFLQISVGALCELSPQKPRCY